MPIRYLNAGIVVFVCEGLIIFSEKGGNRCQSAFTQMSVTIILSGEKQDIEKSPSPYSGITIQHAVLQVPNGIIFSLRSLKALSGNIFQPK